MSLYAKREIYLSQHEIVPVLAMQPEKMSLILSLTWAVQLVKHQQ